MHGSSGDLTDIGDMMNGTVNEKCRQNAIRLEEKEKKEKEILQQIIEEAEEYKREFYRKRQLNVEKKKASNREKEKVRDLSLIHI